MPGLTCFQVNRGAKPEEWDGVRRSNSLAIRPDPTKVKGLAEGKQEVSIESPAGTKTVELTPYAQKPR